MSNTPNLRLPYLDANQNQKSVTHNAALRMLDALVNLHVASAALQAPPAAPADGQCWIVASGGTGAWQGKDLDVAAWQDGAWAFYAPNPGTVAYVDALSAALVWNGTAWVSLLGAVTLAVADVSGAAPLASPALIGTPTAPNAAAGTNTSQIATTSFVAASFVTYAYASANYATAANATLTGTPTAPTQSSGDNSTRLATTAYADRAAGAGNLARVQVADAAYAVQAGDRVVAVTSLSAPRVLTLPAASAFPQGATLTVVDESGACSAGKTITVARASASDAVSGAASAVLATPYGYLALESNGSNKWTVVDSPSGAVASLNGGPLAGFRNRLINGNFAVNQRGYASGAALAAGAYGFDRWKAGSSGCTCAFTAGTPDTAVTITAGSLQQVVETANVEGGVYTLSWAGTAAGRVAYTATGAGSATTTAYAASPVVLPAVNAGLAVTVEFGTGTLAAVQLEPGPLATPFERRPPSVSLLLCQRYFCKSFPQGMTPADAAVRHRHAAFAWSSTDCHAQRIFFPAVMRTTSPTLTFYAPSGGPSPVAGMWQLYDGAGGFQTATSMLTPDAVSDTSFCPDLSGLTLTTRSAYICYGSWTASAEL